MRLAWRAFSNLVLGLGAVAGCADEPPEIEVQITLGHETDAMRVDPAVTEVVVEARNADGDVVAKGSAAPGGSIDLGEIVSSELLTFETRGTDGAGEVVLRGRSLAVLAGGLEGDVMPLFAQRVGAFSRPPGALTRAHVGGVAAVVGERWLLSTGGSLAIDADGVDADPGSADFYDLLAWGGAVSSVMPRRARSIVTRGTAALLIDDFGATWFDFESGDTAEVEAPEGLSFGLIVGGITVDAPDGVSFVVGSTRGVEEPGALPTRDILRVDADGVLSAASLNVSRAGATATWADGVGLVVVGGSGLEAGVEVLGEDQDLARTLPFPSDATTGAGLAAVSEGVVMRVGGVVAGGPAPTALFPLGCTAECVADVVAPEGAIAVELAGVRAFGTARGVLAIGRDELEGTRAFLVPLDRTAPVEVPLREPRRGAAVVAAPNGTLAVLGGQREDGSPALTVEGWFPP